MIICEICEQEIDCLEDQMDHVLDGHESPSPETMIPFGWEFDTADFSVRGKDGRVMLRRDKRGQEWWFGLSEEDREKTDLYISGSGNNLKEAIKMAISKIKPETVSHED